MKRQILLLLMLLITVSAFASPGSSYEMIDSNDHIALYYDELRNDVAVMNLDTGYSWYALLGEDTMERHELGELWSARAKSLYEFQYSIPNDENIYLGVEENEENTISHEVAGDTLVLSHDLTKLRIRFDMEFSLTDTGVEVSIPFDSLDEYGENDLVSISPLPFFGAAEDTIDGYAFYPDGSGALHHFTEAHPEFITDYRAMVYNKPIMDTESDIYDGEPVLVPVYGMKHGSDAFVAYATAGDTDMNISFSPSGYRIDFNRIGAEFFYRHTYKIKRSNVVSKSTQSLNTVVEIIDNMIVEGDRVLNIDLLSGAEASYSGMANAYRAHLLETGEIVDRIEAGEAVPVQLKNLLGIIKERILADKFITMTDFEQLSAMVSELDSMGVEKLMLQLVGWEKKGYRRSPGSTPVARQVGGKKGLEAFVGTLEGSDHEVFLGWNEVDAYRENRGFSVYNDVLKNPLGLVITNAFSSRFVLSPIESEKRMREDMVEYFEGTGINGIQLFGAGELLLMDNHDGERQMRSDTLRTLDSMLEASIDAFGSVANLSGNKYVLRQSANLSEVPTEDSGYYFNDMAVPFYQMLIHGYIPYTGRPGNLHWDIDYLKLKWVEYGFNPYFELTWLDALELKDTNYTRLFNSSYDQWKETLAEISNEFNDRLSSVYSQAMVDHESVTEDLVAVTYADGTRVLVNYSEEAVSYQGAEVAPSDYLVLPEDN